jgi:hypothetical protein
VQNAVAAFAGQQAQVKAEAARRQAGTLAVQSPPASGNLPPEGTCRQSDERGTPDPAWVRTPRPPRPSRRSRREGHAGSDTPTEETPNERAEETSLTNRDGIQEVCARTRATPENKDPMRSEKMAYNFRRERST